MSILDGSTVASLVMSHTVDVASMLPAVLPDPFPPRRPEDRAKKAVEPQPARQRPAFDGPTGAEKMTGRPSAGPSCSGRLCAAYKLRGRRGGACAPEMDSGARTHLVRSFPLEGDDQLDHCQGAKPWLAFIPLRSASRFAEASLHALIATDCSAWPRATGAGVWDEPRRADPPSWPHQVP